MFLILLRVFYFLICTSAIATFVHPTNAPKIVEGHEISTFLVLLAITQSVTAVDIFIPRKRVEVISALYFGLLIGFLLSYSLVLAFNPVFDAFKLEDKFRGGFSMMLTLIITYFSTSLLMQTRDDFRFVIPYVEFSRELKGLRPLILDSSALIDGRIADVVETRILDSKMFVPDFVLKEVQDIADSTDKNRRMRGRRGLEVLAKLQQIPHVEVQVYDSKARELEYRNMTVDQRLVELGKLLNGRVVTSDFNLNRVAAVQGVEVINLNDVANSLRPRYLPGDTMRVRIIREGEAVGQGVGYLDDGTMVVCEQSRDQIGKEIDATVTSVLQSSSGRMIFARPAGSPGKV